MTPREKAEELVSKYVKFKLNGRFKFFGLELSKQCALIAVDEILKVIHINMEDKYWKEVKQEIEKL